MEAKALTPLQILDAAIDRLHRWGWTQNEFGSVQSANCVSGALWYGMCDLLGVRTAAGAKRVDKLCYQAVVNAVAKVAVPYPWPYPTLLTWNDAPERTVEDVLLVLKDAHSQLEAADGS